MFFCKGYKVKLTGRAGLIYSEGKKRMRVDSELLGARNADMVIWSSSIEKWEPPHEAERVSLEDKLRIRENISKSLKRLRVIWQ